MIKTLITESISDDDDNVVDTDLESSLETAVRMVKSVLHKCYQLCRNADSAGRYQYIMSDHEELQQVVEGDVNYEIFTYHSDPPVSPREVVDWILFLAVKYEYLKSERDRQHVKRVISSEILPSVNARYEFISKGKSFNVMCRKVPDEATLNLIAHDLIEIIESHDYADMRRDVKTTWIEMLIDVFKFCKHRKVNINSVSDVKKMIREDLVPAYLARSHQYTLSEQEISSMFSDLAPIPKELLAALMEDEGIVRHYDEFLELFDLSRHDISYIKHSADIMSGDPFYGYEEYHTFDPETREYTYTSPTERPITIVKVPTREQITYIASMYMGGNYRHQVGNF